MVAPLGSGLAMPSADRVGRDERRQTIPDRFPALEHREHPSLFGSKSWPRYLSAEYVERLAHDLIAARRKAMGSLSRRDVRNAGAEEVPGGEPTLGWDPSGPASTSPRPPWSSHC